MLDKKYIVGDSTASAIIDASIEKIDLGDWMFSITSLEYQACSVGHQGAVQGVMPDGKRLSINVETIDGIQFVQNYIEEIAERSHVLGLSKNTQIWSSNGPGVLEVHWSLKAKSIEHNRTEITCSVQTYTDKIEVSKFVEEHSKNYPRGKTPFDLHIQEEAPLFAKDIEKKANDGVWS